MYIESMETTKRILEPREVYTTRLIKSEDLNHHGTLFAGRTAEWFVESGFISAALLLHPNNIVCLKVHGMYFSKPARPGEILKFASKIVYTGRTSLTSHIKVVKAGTDETMVSGFVTFIHVDPETRPVPHNIEIRPVTDEDKALYTDASNLKRG